MTKSLNQAFLRAFSKDGSVPGSTHKLPVGPPSPLVMADPSDDIPEAPATQIRFDAGSDGDELYGPPRAADVPAPHFSAASDSEGNEPGDAHPREADEPVLDLESRETWILGDAECQPMVLDTGPSWVIPVSEPLIEWPATTEVPRFEAEIPEDSPEADAVCLGSEPEVAGSRAESALSEEELQALAPPSTTEGEREVVATPDDREEGFAGAWEVDHLGWTTVCRQLYEGESLPFLQAGQQLFTAAAEGLRVLAITSAYRGEGRTTLSLLLARAAAAAGVRVAVMDADLDNPQLAWNARLQPASDWRRVLMDGSPLEEAAICAVDERMTLFPLETQSRGEPLRLSDPRVTKLVHDMASRFDLLIIDMGPIAHDDRRLFAGGKVCPIDAAVVVRDLRSTTVEQTQSVVRRLVDLGVEAVGIAENFARDC